MDTGPKAGGDRMDEVSSRKTSWNVERESGTWCKDKSGSCR